MSIYLDTNMVIYAVENPVVWGPKATARLTALRVAGDSFMLSDLTRMECLVGPLKAGKPAVAAQFRAFFAATGVAVVPITATVCDQAAQSRPWLQADGRPSPCGGGRTRGQSLPDQRYPTQRLHWPDRRSAVLNAQRGQARFTL